MKKIFFLLLAVCVLSSVISYKRDREITNKRFADMNWETFDQETIKLYRSGEYDRAMHLANAALIVATKDTGHDHYKTAASLNNLALLYAVQGYHAKAETFYNRSLNIFEKTLKSKNSDIIAGIMNNQNEYAEVERLYKRSIDNLIEIYRKEKDYEKVESFYKRAWNFLGKDSYKKVKK